MADDFVFEPVLPMEQTPSDDWVTHYVLWLAFAALCLGVYSQTVVTARGRATLLRSLGVNLRRIARASKEIERKAFHLGGLAVPLGYQLLLNAHITHLQCSKIILSLTAITWIIDVARLHIPRVQELMLKSPLGVIMRDDEKLQLTGASYFSLGLSMAICLFPPSLAITSILHLVLGDMAAALIGVAFGGEVCVVKLGRHGKKSMEGSVAMFVVCFLVTISVFGGVHLIEYTAFLSALVATVTELYSEEIFYLNDNLTIPILSCLSMAFGFSRTANCYPCVSSQ